MKNFFKKIVGLSLLILFVLSYTACSANHEDFENKLPEKFSPTDNMTKLVIVTNKFCFNTDYENTLNCFNQKLMNLGKNYYIDLEIIDNIPNNNTERESETTSYSIKYQDAVMKMKSNKKPVDIITMANIDDSSGYSDYDSFYLNEIIMPIDDYLSSEKNKLLKDAINEKVWDIAKRDGKTYIVPTSSVSAVGRGWEVKTSSLKKLGITEKDLQGEIWEILKNNKLANKKIYAEPVADSSQSGSGDPLPPYNAEIYYDLITSCVGVKFSNDVPTAINIFKDEYMEKSISSSYKLSPLEDNDLYLCPVTITNPRVTKTSDTTYVPIDNQIYLSGDLCGLGVASWTENKEYALDLISELNTNKELALLLNYGVEGENYIIDNDGHINVSDSQFEEYKNPYYIFSNRGILPIDNMINATENLDSSIISPICGFIFDSTNVKDEIESTNKVIEKYRETLFVGNGNYKVLKEKFLKELEKAGVQNIVDEANNQILTWKEKNK